MRYQWKNLNKLQVGAFSEYFVKMEMTMYGFQVYTTEVDDRGIDFVMRYEDSPFYQIQVKSVRKNGYVFVQKEKFTLSEETFLALAILNEGESPELFLIPSTTWRKPTGTFVDRDYEDKASKPEWGINISNKNMEELRTFRFEKVIKKLMTKA